jgi:hypothetical protein
MGPGILKPILIAISTAFAGIVYTKKRLKKEGKLKVVHSKTDGHNYFTKN